MKFGTLFGYFVFHLIRDNRIYATYLHLCELVCVCMCERLVLLFYLGVYKKGTSCGNQMIDIIRSFNGRLWLKWNDAAGQVQWLRRLMINRGDSSNSHAQQYWINLTLHAFSAALMARWPPSLPNSRKNANEIAIDTNKNPRFKYISPVTVESTSHHNTSLGLYWKWSPPSCLVDAKTWSIKLNLTRDLLTNEKVNLSWKKNQSRRISSWHWKDCLRYPIDSFSTDFKLGNRWEVSVSMCATLHHLHSKHSLSKAHNSAAVVLQSFLAICLLGRKCMPRLAVVSFSFFISPSLSLSLSLIWFYCWYCCCCFCWYLSGQKSVTILIEAQ